MLNSSFLVFCVCIFWLNFVTGKNTYDKEISKGKDKLRLCIVEGKGSFHKTAKYCPILEASTNIECIVGVDRLDCVRRISKGYAHFGVFSSEDLIAARWAGVEVLVTSELRFNAEDYEYEMVAIVDNEADINTAADVRGSKFCHPGRGMQNRWTEVIADYFESLLIPKGCESDLSLAESRIKASSEFFGPTCKAGPWSQDPVQDAILKKRYPSMCKLCYDPYSCSIGDKHWGRRGPLYCLTSGAGQIAYVRVDDVRSHFGLSGLPAQADASSYSFLCPDGHLQPLNSTRPCVWVAKPWPVIAAKRTHAAKVHDLFDSLRRTGEDNWETALLMLLESYHVNISSLHNSIPIDDYLDHAEGFQSAYSFPSCNPPRSIVYCTTSIVDFVKCSWLQEASQVYGVEPNIRCIRGEHIYRCLDDVAHQTADAVLVDQDFRLRAEEEYNLTAILHEYSTEFINNYVTVAVVKANSDIKSFDDLKGRSVCLPNNGGSAYWSVVNVLNNLNKTSKKCESELKNYFSKNSCLWDKDNCPIEYQENEGALRCLAAGRDVAFMSMDVFNNMTQKNGSLYNEKFDSRKFRLLCPPFQRSFFNRFNHDNCFLNWAPRGSVMVYQNITQLRMNEIKNSLKSMDKIFGKEYQGHTIPFSMYGPFDNKNNIIFRDSTDSLKTRQELRKNPKFDRNLEDFYESYDSEKCKVSSSISIISSTLLISLCSLLNWIL